jgi:transcription initiation factor TFIIE subunit alpha|tara:strand:- start:22096 stop:22914 length:819 start_codon:yes stop_codon:yes gene_type:complete
MDLLNKILEDFFMEVIGKDVFDLFKLLRKKDYVSEFVLAEKIGLTVNQVRNMLYRFYSYSLVDFIRKKDKKKGWYIYYWGFNTKRALEVALEHKQERLDLLTNLLQKEENNQYFNCKDCEIRLSFEQAIENDYKCPECDSVLEQDNNTRKIQRLSKLISTLEEEISKGKEIKVEEKKPEEKKSVKRKRKVTKKAKKKPKRRAKKKVVRKKKPARKKPKKRAAKRGAAKKKKPSSKKLLRKVPSKGKSKKKLKKKFVSKKPKRKAKKKPKKGK